MFIICSARNRVKPGNRIPFPPAGFTRMKPGKKVCRVGRVGRIRQSLEPSSPELTRLSLVRRRMRVHHNEHNEGSRVDIDPWGIHGWVIGPCRLRASRCGGDIKRGAHCAQFAFLVGRRRSWAERRKVRLSKTRREPRIMHPPAPQAGRSHLETAMHLERWKIFRTIRL